MGATGDIKLNECLISFIIPTYNESLFIARNIRTIKKLMTGIQYEIIVVDNGSTDDTRSQALAENVVVKNIPDATIAGLRNAGARDATGRVLVFLDADVLITTEWRANINDVIDTMLKSGSFLITGSRCDIGNTPSWIERFWFKPLVTERANYINSGHLIIEKRFFQMLGGFDDGLVTTEDYELCQRAKKMGGIINNNPSLRVVHEGYPKSLYEFYKRERWHGYQDVKTLRFLLRSKVAIASVLYLICLVLALISFLSLNVKLALEFVALSFLISFMSTVYRRKKVDLRMTETVVTFLLYNIYFLSRSLAIFDSLRNKICTKNNRSRV